MGNANRISPQSTTTTEQCILTSAAASRIHVVQHVRIHIPAAIPPKNILNCNIRNRIYIFLKNAIE